MKAAHFNTLDRGSRPAPAPAAGPALAGAPTPAARQALANPVLRLVNVEKYFGNKSNVCRALDGVSFDVDTGEFVAIMGPSGSGKTTLLNCISTIDRPSAGNIFVNGVDITTLRSRDLTRFPRDELGFIFQDSNLLDNLTARENIALALTIAGAPAAEVSAKVEKVAQTLGIQDALDKMPCEMSGGQRQRTAAARAIVCDPSLVLADEPTGALDSRNSRRMLESLGALNRDGATIIMVTHDSFAASFATRVIFIKDGRLWSELSRGQKTRAIFFDEVLDTVSFLGGEVADAR